MNLNILKNIVIPAIKKEFIKTAEDMCETIVYGSSKNTKTCTGGSACKTIIVGSTVMYRP